MSRQGVLFPKPAIKRRVLMHVSDAGGADHGEGAVIVTFRCGKCSYETEWLKCDTVTEAKRGLPCPRCNELWEYAKPG
jgi:hypothetical protein